MDITTYLHYFLLQITELKTVFIIFLNCDVYSGMLNFKKCLLLLVIILSQHFATLAQCTTNQLNFVTNSDWILFSNNIGLPNNTPAKVISHLVIPNTYWWDSTAAGSWISCLNTGIHPTNGNQFNHAVRYRYTFKSCGDDSLRINMNFFRDNFCKIYLDNNLVFSDPQSQPTDQNNLNVGTTITKYITVSGSGLATHYLDFEIIEYDVAYNLNGWGGKMNGSLTSVGNNNTLVLNTPACQNYTCCNISSFAINGATNLCIGESTTLSTNSTNSITWTNSTTNVTTIGNNITITPNATVTYNVTAQDANGCSISQSVTVNVGSKPVLSITKSNDVGCNQQQATLTAIGALNYTWGPADNLNTNIGNTVIATPTQTTTYYVYGSNGGCGTQDSITVFADGDLSSQIALPQVFTPNGDGQNDCYRIVSLQQFKTFSINIYNRWGQKVYSTNDPTFCWYGNINGFDSKENGTYFYELKGETACKTYKQKGDFTILW
jgi:gliding motility-associated-like protein